MIAILGLAAAGVFFSPATGILGSLLGIVGVSLITVLILVHPSASLATDFTHPAFLYRLLLLFGYFVPLIYLFETAPVSNLSVLRFGLFGLFMLVTNELGSLVLHGKSPERGTEDPAKRADDGPLVAAFLVVAALGWVWRTYLLLIGRLYGSYLASQTQGMGSWGNLLGTLSTVSWIGFVGTAVFARRARLPVLLGILECSWLALSGSKASVAFVVATAVLVLYRRGAFRRVRLSMRVAVGGAALVAVVFGFTAVSAYRAATAVIFNEGRWTSAAQLEAIREAAAEETPVAGTLRQLAQRVDLLDTLERVISWSEQHREPQWNGRTYIPILVWWIPRSLWPDKPAVSIGRWYAEEVLGWRGWRRSEGAITVMGDGYLNFGWPGALLGWSLWLGFSFGLFSVMTRSDRWGLFLAACIYYRLLLGTEQNLAAAVVAVEQGIVVAIVVGLVSYGGAMAWRCRHPSCPSHSGNSR